MKMYLVILEGGGDIYIKVVDQETFDWICSDDMGQPADYDDDTSWVDQIVPASQLSKMKADWDKDVDKPWRIKGAEFEFRISRGSWDNDRAIAAFPADSYDTYDTVRDATRAIQKHGDVFEDEYQGCMY